MPATPTIENVALFLAFAPTADIEDFLSDYHQRERGADIHALTPTKLRELTDAASQAALIARSSGNPPSEDLLDVYAQKVTWLGSELENTGQRLQPVRPELRETNALASFGEFLGREDLADGCTCGLCGPGCSSAWLRPCCGACT